MVGQEIRINCISYNVGHLSGGGCFIALSYTYSHYLSYWVTNIGNLYYNL